MDLLINKRFTEQPTINKISDQFSYNRIFTKPGNGHPAFLFLSASQLRNLFVLTPDLLKL
jgi:hypothetical protein